MKRLLAFTLAVVGCAQSRTPGACEDGSCGARPLALSGEPRLWADPPFGLGFSCILIGCTETKTLVLSNRGGGALNLTKVEWRAPESATDLTLVLRMEPDAEPLLSPTAGEPVVLAGGEELELEVTYAPTDAVSDAGELLVRWHDGALAYENSALRSLEFPITARVLPKAHAALRTTDLRFGFVPLGSERTLAVELENTSAQDAVLAVVEATLSENDSFFLAPGAITPANPGEVLRIPVTYAPRALVMSQALLRITTNAQEKPVEVLVLGTAVPGAYLMLEEARVDFGAQRLGSQVSRSVRLWNTGGAPVTVTTAWDNGATGFASSVSAFELDVLADVLVDVTLTAATPGWLRDRLVFDTEHTEQEDLPLELVAFCEAPVIEVSATSIVLPTAVDGWVLPLTPITVRNTGTGALRVERVFFDPTSTPQVRFAAPLSLPVILQPDDPAWELPLTYYAAPQGTVQARLWIHTDAISLAELAIDLSGNIVTCNDGCPTSHGAPACGANQCDVGQCDSGWHDTNRQAGDGCECHAENAGHDVGDVCRDATDVGWLGDDCSSYPSEKVRQGTLHSATDIDLYVAHTEDAGGFCDIGGDSAAARVELVSGPPGLVLCASIQEADMGCGGYTHVFDPNLCGQNRYNQNGHTGDDDNRDITAWVMWRPDATPVCEPYVLKFRGKK